MKFSSLVCAAAVLLAASSAFAHETGNGPNGGRVTDAGKYHVELVAKDKVVDVYLLDGSEKPVPADGFKATAILVANGKSARIALTPAGASRLTGTSEVPLTSAPKGAVQLTAPDGSTASGRFN